MDKYRQMMAFVWANEYGSFSAAARANNLTPSTISKLVSGLENRLGVRLFRRGARQLTLTEEGLLYLQGTKNVMDAIAEVDTLAEALPKKISGNLKIRTMPTFAKHQILPWLPEFLDRYPLINLEFELSAIYEDDFERGTDIAIYGGNLPSSNRIAKRIGESEWITCASPRYLEQYGSPKNPIDLINHRCFHFNFPSPWNCWTFIENKEIINVPIKPIASFSQGEFIRELGLGHQGIIRLADYHIGKDIRTGHLVPILCDYKYEIIEPLYIIYINRRLQSPRVKCFIDFLQQKINLNPWKVII